MERSGLEWGRGEGLNEQINWEEREGPGTVAKMMLEKRHANSSVRALWVFLN